MPEFEVAWHEPGRGRRTGRLTAADASRIAPALGIAPERLLSVRMLPPRQGGAGAGRGALSLRLFAQELAVLLDAGIPLLEAVATLEQKEQRAAAARSLAALHAALAEGSALSAALAAQPRVFDEMYVAVVRANERSGSLAAALRAHSQYLHWAERLRARLVGALVYPLLLLVVGSAVVLFLLLYVMPRFAGVFEGNATPLPWASRLLFALGSAAAAHPLVACAVWALPGALAVAAWRTPALRAHAVAFAWRLPGLGARLRVLALAAVYRALGMLLGAGVPVLAALAPVREVAAAPLRDAFARVGERVAHGERLSGALDREGLATPVAQRMLRVGESSGELPQMLARAAAFHDEELERLGEWVAHALNPLLMALLGVVVGGIVLLMYLPIFDLIEQVP